MDLFRLVQRVRKVTRGLEQLCSGDKLRLGRFSLEKALGTQQGSPQYLKGLPQKDGEDSLAGPVQQHKSNSFKQGEVQIRPRKSWEFFTMRVVRSCTGCPQKLQICVEAFTGQAGWNSGQLGLWKGVPAQGTGWNQMIFKTSFNPDHPRILPLPFLLLRKGSE